jgi:hypothetical protein
MSVDTNAIVVDTVLKLRKKKVFAVQVVNIQKGKLKMQKDKIYCYNCGHECHCGEKCIQEYTDGDGERYEMQICGNCRHERKKKD